jgi:hypothetical protein
VLQLLLRAATAVHLVLSRDVKKNFVSHSDAMMRMVQLVLGAATALHLL